MALGEIDYGLLGLIGGLMVFVTFFNGLLASANSRFYAFSIGEASVATDRGAALEECRKWFNTALSIHSILPCCLVLIGYPCGIYVIEHFLEIPPARLSACLWVFRFLCLSCFVGMINVPFTAMYGAKQAIAELTVYSFVSSTLNVLFVYYMVTHPGDWLARYAAWACLLAIVPQIIICIRACMVFPECKISFKYMWDVKRLKRIGSFSFWQFLGGLCGMLRVQGVSIILNKFFGAAMNAAQNIGNSVQGHCNTLAAAMQGAFVPVITQACGAGDYDRMNRFVIRVCKFNVLLSLIFMLPLSLELQEVMRIWLKKPPAFSTGLCYCGMLFYLVDCCTVGHMVAVNASGRIARYQVVLSAINVFTLPIAVVLGFMTKNVYCIMGVVVSMQVLNSIGRLLFARVICKTGLRAWIAEVLRPSIIAIAATAVIGYIPQFYMRASLCRVGVTTLICEIVFMPLTWFVLLSESERTFVREKCFMRFCHFRKG